MDKLIYNIESFFRHINWEGGHLVIINSALNIIGLLLVVAFTMYLIYFCSAEGKKSDRENYKSERKWKSHYLKLISLCILLIIVGLILLYIKL